MSDDLRKLVARWRKEDDDYPYDEGAYRAAMCADDLEEVLDAEQPVTVQSLLSNQSLVQRRLQTMTEQRFVMESTFPSLVIPPLNRRRRFARLVRRRIAVVRENLALRIAPWLNNEGY